VSSRSIGVEKPISNRPRSGDEKNSIFGMVVAAVISKYGLGAIMAALVIRASWPTLRVLVDLFY